MADAAHPVVGPGFQTPCAFPVATRDRKAALQRLADMDTGLASVYSRGVHDAKSHKTPTGAHGQDASPAAPGESSADVSPPGESSADVSPPGESSADVSPPGGPSESARADDTWVESAAAPASDGDRLRNLALFVPRLLQLIGRLVADPEVPLLDKMILGAAAAYVASPLDILPDAVPLLGQLDDIYLITICLLRLLHRSGEAKLRQHWEGPEDIVQILHTVTDIATRYLPGGLRARLRGWVEAKPPA